MSHKHNISNYNFSFALGVALNIVFVVIELTYGILADSLALIADAGHNFSDVVSLLLAWGANILSRKSATQNRTYGYRKATIMASLASAILLLIALGGIAYEAIERFNNPKPVEGMTVIVVASIGIVINTLTALLFLKDQKHDLNIRGAYLHMLADAWISVGVVIAGIFIIYKNFLWIDPLISLIIVAVILVSTWGLLRDSINYAIDAVPKGVDLPEVKKYLMSFDNVCSIHDLHIWALSTTEVALTVHLVVNNDSLDNDFLRDIQEYMHEYFEIDHSTIQIETSNSENRCMLDSPKCI